MVIYPGKRYDYRDYGTGTNEFSIIALGVDESEGMVWGYLTEEYASSNTSREYVTLRMQYLSEAGAELSIYLTQREIKKLLYQYDIEFRSVLRDKLMDAVARS